MAAAPAGTRGQSVGAVRRATAAMGTRFEVVIAHADAARAGLIAEAALDRVRDLHALWSPFEKTSLMAFIHRTAHERPVRVDPETFALLRTALDVWQVSGGAFDITVGPLMRALGFRGPATAAPAECVVGMEHVVLDESALTVALARPGIELDVGAIAKGAAVDAATEVLREHGITSALVHGGTSSVRAIGAPPRAEGWRVRLGPTSASPTALLADCALSVSAPAGRMVGRGQSAIGHVLDPRTRRPVSGCDVAAVISADATTADAWSTALLVRGDLPEDRPLAGLTRVGDRWEACGRAGMPGLEWPAVAGHRGGAPARTLGRRLGMRIRALMEGEPVA